MSERKLKKGLGRGLSSLLKESVPLSALRARPPTAPAPTPAPAPSSEGTASASAAPAIRVLGIDELRPGAMQPRQHFDAEEIADLARSIQRQGVLQPLLVRPHSSGTGYEIVAGERRWRAAQKAQLHRVPAVVRQLNEQDALEIALIENMQRTDLNPMEESQACQHLIQKFGYTQERLADALGKSRPYITNSLRLQKLAPQIQTYVREGRLSAGAARALIGRPRALALAQESLRRGLNVRQVEALAASGAASASASASASARARRTLTPDMRALERQLSEALGMEVQLKPASQERGRLVVTYRTLAQLERLLSLGGSGQR